MIKKLYVHNFRCLVNFEISFDAYGVLCGPNGSGKSSVFDALTIIRDLASGDAVLGGDGPRDIQSLDLCNWLDSGVQEFELHLKNADDEFVYKLQLEQSAHDMAPRVHEESATCNGRQLFSRPPNGVQIHFVTGPKVGYPLDRRQSALGSIQPLGLLDEVLKLQEELAGLLILRPSPREMEAESRAEAAYPDMHFSNLTSWYRHLAQEQEWIDELRGLLQQVWPDFRSFKLTDAGLRTKALQLRFESIGDRDSGTLFFDQLSDGEKSLVGLYMIVAALRTGASRTVLIDEPDNFVGLPELQPWVTSLLAELDEKTQAILITHHPEILGSSTAAGRYCWRENHTSPTRVGPLRVPAGLTAGEAMARGWASGE